MPRLTNIRGMAKEITRLEELAKQAAYLQKNRQIIEFEKKIKLMSDEELEALIESGNYPKPEPDPRSSNYHLMKLSEDELHHYLNSLTEEELTNSLIESLRYP